MLSVSIIGVGRVGGALALSLPQEKYSVDLLVDHNSLKLDEISRRFPEATVAESLIDGPPIEADIVLITTQDNCIETAVSELLTAGFSARYVFHTSGALSSLVLSELNVLGCSVGSIHPLISISRPEVGPERFRNGYFCLEGDPDAVEIGRAIITDLGGIPFSIDTKFKTLYHAAAVTACGHLVALFDSAVEMMTKCGLSSEDSKKILMPLVKSTVENMDLQSTSSALTGTFARADTNTFTRHLSALNESVSDELLEIYLLLGERSLELAAKEGVNPERIDVLRTKVLIAKSKLKW